MPGNRPVTPADNSAARVAVDRLCLHHRIEQQAITRPDAIAVSCGEQQLSYSELDQRANRLANTLLAAGVLPDTTVGLCLDRSVELVVGLLGILKAGGAYVPLDPAYPPDRLAHIVDQAAPQLIVSTAELATGLSAASATIVDINSTTTASNDRPTTNVGPDNLCYAQSELLSDCRVQSECPSGEDCIDGKCR